MSDNRTFLAYLLLINSMLAQNYDKETVMAEQASNQLLIDTKK
jgi:hypothetical protein